ncbi:hypothetical protein QEX66_gp03 [Arthrobacter phage Corgi]|uniref:Uncharacterized protein n=1 Tax=Arthrobacter phage Corgi TaxID=2419952 RepID=A0A3G2KF27_9CAUD|nr:hypothetical protein QEX66_gp03 [Arthrobacter phage Corgi]AYN57551.1 hypothetical protein PBI_CORGI_3 [Arthrobacter phage Corgi]
MSNFQSYTPPATVTRDQLLAAVAALGLDPECVERVTLDHRTVVVTTFSGLVSLDVTA